MASPNRRVVGSSSDSSGDDLLEGMKPTLEQDPSTSSTLPEIPVKSLKESGHTVDDFEKDHHPVTAKTRLMDHLKSMIMENKTPDLAVKIGNEQFFCYSIVLRSYSLAIFKMEQVTSIVLPAQIVSPRAFKILYKWMISEEPISVPLNLLLELVDAVNFLAIESFTEQSLNYIFDENVMSEDQVFLTYLEAKNRNFDFSSELLVKGIRKFFLTLVSFKEFVDLNVTGVCALLSSPNIGVNCELETFMSAIRWLDYDWKNREKHVSAVMECIRFSLIAPWLLTALQQPDVEIPVKRVVSVTRVSELIKEAICFSSSILLDATSPQAASKKYPFESRFWVYDHGCFYHHKHTCPNMIVDLSYKDFLKYLKVLRCCVKYYFTPWETAFTTSECRCKGNGEGGLPNAEVGEGNQMVMDENNAQLPEQADSTSSQEKNTSDSSALQLKIVQRSYSDGDAKETEDMSVLELDEVSHIKLTRSEPNLSSESCTLWDKETSPLTSLSSDLEGTQSTSSLSFCRRQPSSDLSNTFIFEKEPQLKRSQSVCCLSSDLEIGSTPRENSKSKSLQDLSNHQSGGN